MIRHDKTLVLMIAGVLASVLISRGAVASPYYAPTYVGRSIEMDSSFTNRTLENRTTGVVYSVDSGTKYLTEADSAALNLPRTTVLVGGAYPSPQTFSMRGAYINESTGTVIGTIPSGGSRGMPMSSILYGYAQPDSDGKYFEFHSLTTDQLPNHYIYLNSADQILLREIPYRMTMGEPQRTLLIDLKAGVESPLESLVDPEFLGRYGRLDVKGLTARGDIIVEALPRDENGMLDSFRADMYILTPPGVSAPTPIPEPSLLWLAAAGMAFHLLRRKAARAA